MISELIYTSSQSLLKPGPAGFGVVAASKGLGDTTIKLLEGMSGYRHIVAPERGPNKANPNNWMHLRQPNGSSVLARVSDAGLDHSGRTNKLAQFAILSREAQSAAGPAATLRGGSWLDQWSGEARLLPARESLASVSSPSGPCKYWQQIMGDAGWAGVLAESIAKKTGKEWNLVFDANIDCLRLVEEAIALLPISDRWAATFATYFMGTCTNQLPCQWRFVFAGSKEHQALRGSNRNVIELLGQQPCTHSSVWIDSARTGTPVEQPTPAMVSVGTRSAGSAKSAGVTDTSWFDDPAMASGNAGGIRSADMGPSDFGQSNSKDYLPPRAFKKKKPESHSLIPLAATGIIALLLGGLGGAGGMHVFKSQDTALKEKDLDIQTLNKKIDDDKDSAEKAMIVKDQVINAKDQEIKSVTEDKGKAENDVADKENELVKIKDIFNKTQEELTSTKKELLAIKEATEKTERTQKKEKQSTASTENIQAATPNQHANSADPKKITSEFVQLAFLNVDGKYFLDEKTAESIEIMLLSDGKLNPFNPSRKLNNSDTGFSLKGKKDLLGSKAETLLVSLISKSLRPESALEIDSWLWISFKDHQPLLLWNRKMPLPPRIGLNESKGISFNVPPGLAKDAMSKATIVSATIDGEEFSVSDASNNKKSVWKELKARDEPLTKVFTQKIEVKCEANVLKVITTNGWVPATNVPSPDNTGAQAKRDQEQQLPTLIDIQNRYRDKPIVVVVELPQGSGLKSPDGIDMALRLNFEFVLDIPASK
jgi:hypothetical protein